MTLDNGYWESPIHLSTQWTVSEINKTVEGEIMNAVMKVGVDVDKERLLKALIDAKSFYEEGYADGMRGSMVHGLKTNADEIRSMSNLELARFLSTPCECSVDPKKDGYRECGNQLCVDYLLKWLQEPSEEIKNGL